MNTAPALFASTAPSLTDVTADLAETFSVTSNTQVPGKILKPGTYTIRILDHLADRIALRIEDSHGKSEGVFLGVPNADLAGRMGPISWQNGPHKTDALRGFAFPSGAVEFVYAKEEAVPLAKANASKVLAIDPASEGRPKASNLSDEDRKLVTLWTLAATRVGPEGGSQPAIKAERYNAPAVTEARQPSPAPAATVQATTAPAPPVVSRPTPPLPQVARAKRPAPISTLPHTASELPLVAGLALFFIFAAATLRIVRSQRS